MAAAGAVAASRLRAPSRSSPAEGCPWPPQPAPKGPALTCWKLTRFVATSIDVMAGASSSAPADMLGT